ncbi:MAG TPA: NAD(P)/FAD-dependent oxidoreductase [Methanomicrobiales archaeon]|nr:NAD(P)/FAD-dependent oxidoreductase [Methanomicrobiales archaeon]
MKVAIAGAGIAGGYLARLLGQKGVSPDVFDGMDHGTRCGCRSCGWGVPEGIRPYLAGVGLDLDRYLLGSMSSMDFDGLMAETPLSTLDKPRLLRDLAGGAGLKRCNLGPEMAGDYDVVVDATGVARSFLPPCRSDLTLPTLQHRVAVSSKDGGRMKIGVFGEDVPGLGYLWIFPLGNGEYHIGIGGIGLSSHGSLLERFFRESAGGFSFTHLCGCSGSVRVASPYYSTPLFVRRTRNDGNPRLVVGIGEAIGTVSPFTGEGIVYSLECARMLADSWLRPEEYARSVLARFAWMRKERETLDYLLSQKGKEGPRFRDRWRFYRNARRSGIGLPLLEAFKRMGSLSRWVDTRED